MINRLQNKILSLGETFGFASIQSEYALALEGLLPYTILTTPAPHWQRDLPSDIQLLIPLAKATNTLDLLFAEESRNFLQHSATSLLVFKTSFQLERICQKKNVNLLAPPSHLGRKLENKLYLREFLRDTPVSLVPQENIPCTLDGLALAKKNFSFPMVIQFAKGFSGNSSFLIEDEQAFLELIENKGGKKAKVSPFIEGGISLTINGCALSKGVALSQTFRQLTGISALTPKRLAACGNDWNLEFLPKADLVSLEKMALLVGNQLIQRGFRGFFGLDFLWHPKRGTFLIEINPRFTGSINLATKREIEAGETPLILLHIAEMLGLEPEVPQPSFFANPAATSQLIIHAKAPIKIEKILPGGIYRFSDFTFLRRAFSYLDLRNKDEFLLQPAPVGSHISFGREMGRMIWKGSAGEHLSPEILRLVHQFRQKVVQSNRSLKAG